MKYLVLALMCVCMTGCNRDTVFAGDRLDVEIEWDYLYSKGKRIPLYGESRKSPSWVPAPNIIPSGDPKSVLIGLGLLIGVCVTITLVNEIVDVARSGNITFGRKLVEEMKIRIAVGGKLYVSDVLPGQNRIVLTEELKNNLMKSESVFNVYATGSINLNYSFRVGPIRNPSTCIIKFNGDGFVFINDIRID